MLETPPSSRAPFQRQAEEGEYGNFPEQRAHPGLKFSIWGSELWDITYYRT